MKSHLSRIDLLNEYEQAPESTLFCKKTVAAIRDYRRRSKASLNKGAMVSRSRASVT